MKKIFKLFIIFLFLIVPNMAFSAKPVVQLDMVTDMPIKAGESLTLQDCINIALKRSPSIKDMRYNWQTAKHNVSIAKSAYTPTLSAGAGYDRTYNTSHRMQHTTRTLPSVDVRLKEMIFNFGKTNANIRMEKFYKIAAEYNFDQEVINTIYDVKCKYYQVLAAKALMDIEKANVQINERNYQRTKAYFDEGIRSKIDVVNAEVYLSDAKVQLVTAETNYKNAIIALNNAMYVAYAPEYSIKNTESFNFKHDYLPVSLIKMTNYKDISNLPEAVYNATLTTKVEKSNELKNYVFQKFPMTFDESVQYAYANRFDLKSLDATKKAMEQSLLYVKREYYPELAAGVGYGYLHSLHHNENGSFDISVDLTSSVNPFQKKHEIDNAKIQVEKAQNDIDELKQNVYFDVQKTYVEMLAQEKQIPLNEVKVRQTLENLELADGRYEVGLGDFIEVQDAKVNYNNAQHTYVNNILNYNVSRATLEREIAKEEVSVKLEDEKPQKNKPETVQRKNVQNVNNTKKDNSGVIRTDNTKTETPKTDKVNNDNTKTNKSESFIDKIKKNRASKAQQNTQKNNGSQGDKNVK